MIPAYRTMDTYPCQRNQMPYPHYYHPNIEPIPPQMKVDPSKPPFTYDQRWPYAGNFGHPTPPHFCCGHHNYPCYSSYMPSYPHASSPMYYSGACPSYGEPHFIPYTPQPHYTMELPRYEYDKYMPRDHHCCGCPNNPCNQKEGKGVKIEEEHERDDGKKINDALVPIQLKNYPYPFVWIPQEYTSNKQLKNPYTMEVSEQDKISPDRKSQPPLLENSNCDAQPAQEPRVWNGWLPFDIKGAPNMFHDGYGVRNQKHEAENNRRESEDGKMDQKHQSEPKRSDFPFPIFWLPYHNKQEESAKTTNQENTSSPKIIEEVPHSFKSIPAKSHVNEGGANGSRSNQAEYANAGASDAVEKVTNVKSIPVKQINLNQDKNDSEGSQQREINASQNQMEEKVAKEDSCTGDKKRQSTSPPKGSKLPPVCLRVDPLPKKKNGKGSSRSPSPPSSKEHAKATAGEPFKPAVQDAPNTSEKVKAKEKTIPVSGSKSSSPPFSKEDSKAPAGEPFKPPVHDAPNSSEKVKPKEKTIPVSDLRFPFSKEHCKASAGEPFKPPVQDASDTSEKVKPKEKTIPVSECKISEECGTNDKAHQNAPNTSGQVKPKEKTTIPVTECKTSENKGADSGDGCQSQVNVHIPSEGPKGTMETCTNGDEYKTEDKKEGKGTERITEETTGLKELRDSSTLTDADQKVGRVLSDVDAAVLIQATYRGYQVRKWEPLKKLKQIDEVRKEVINVRGLVEAFERSSDLQNDDKQKVAIGEDIMRLLLKLDSIQGLHPSFREIRKTLARELTILQERLDSVMTKKPQQQVQDFDVEKHVEVTPTQSEEHVQKLQEEKVMVSGDSSKGISDDVKDPCANDGASESQSPVDSASNEVAESVTLPNGSDNDDVSEVVAADAMNSTSDLSETDKTAMEFEAKSDANNIPIEVTVREESPVEVIDNNINNVSTEKDEHADGTSESLPAMAYDSARGELDSENHAVMELPVGVLDEDERENEKSISKGEAQSENEIITEELPLGLLDEDAVISDAMKHDQAKPKTYKEVLLAQGQRNGEQHQKPEEQEEVQSSGESDGWVKIEFEEGELRRDVPMNLEVESQSGEEVGNETKAPLLTTQDNGGDSHKPRGENVCTEPNHVNNIIQKEEEPEENTEQKMETQDMVSEQAISADNKDTKTLAQEKTELSAASLLSSQEPELPVAEKDGALLEENEKLREMMKKLLETGNEQLGVISELTGRVKDLEKKLARSRNKKVRTKRYRPATTSRMSSTKCLQ